MRSQAEAADLSAEPAVSNLAYVDVGVLADVGIEPIAELLLALGGHEPDLVEVQAPGAPDEPVAHAPEPPAKKPPKPKKAARTPIKSDDSNPAVKTSEDQPPPPGRDGGRCGESQAGADPRYRHGWWS